MLPSPHKDVAAAVATNKTDFSDSDNDLHEIVKVITTSNDPSHILYA